AGQAREVVDAEIEEGVRAAAIEPRRPERLRLAVAGTGEVDAPDVALLHALPDGLVGGAEDHVRRADEQERLLSRERDQPRRRLQGRRRRLLHEHVLASLERGRGDLAVALRRREDEQEIDLVRGDELARLGGEADRAEPLAYVIGAARIDVADGHGLDE